MNEIEGMSVNYINGIKVSVLMYSDDLMLLSQTKNGFQHGINMLNSFCTENILIIDTNKAN